MPLYFLYLSEVKNVISIGLGEVVFIIATAYLAWNFKFLLGILLDLTPMINGLRRRLWILAGQALRMAGIAILMSTIDITLIWLAAAIALTGDALVDMGADALLVDIAPPDWHGIGFGAGWATRAIGYSVSALVISWIITTTDLGWMGVWTTFLIFTLPVFMMLVLREPKDVENRTITKKAIAETFSDTKAAASFFFIAFFSGAAYGLDPNRGVIGAITLDKLKLKAMSKMTYNEFLEYFPVYGAIMASFGIGAALGAAIMGYFTDRIGHRKSYYISLTGFLVILSLWLLDPETIGQYIWGANPAFAGILLLAFLLGYFEGWNFVAWETIIADMCPPQIAGFTFQYGMTGTHFSAFLIAIITEPLLDIDVSLAIVVAGMVIAIGYIPVLFMRPFKTSKVEQVN